MVFSKIAHRQSNSLIEQQILVVVRHIGTCLTPSRCNLGGLEADAGNMKRAVRHFMIAALPGCYFAMQALNKSFEQGFVSRDTVKSTLTAYNNYCAEMRSEAKNHDRNKLYCYE